MRSAFALVLLVGALVSAPALGADPPDLVGRVKANAAWVGRSDVNVHVSLRDKTATGALLVAPTEMIGPFTATELRDVLAGTLSQSGKTICATAYAYVGNDPNVTGASVRSTEVAAPNCVPFPLGPPGWQ